MTQLDVTAIIEAVVTVFAAVLAVYLLFLVFLRGLGASPFLSVRLAYGLTLAGLLADLWWRFYPTYVAPHVGEGAAPTAVKLVLAVAIVAALVFLLVAYNTYPKMTHAIDAA